MGIESGDLALDQGWTYCIVRDGVVPYLIGGVSGRVEGRCAAASALAFEGFRLW